MAEIWYTAVKAFGPEHAEEWAKFLEFSGLSQLTRVVTLDGMLCPTVIEELDPADWDHNIQQDYRLHYFTDLDYLLERVGPDFGAQILAVTLEPGRDCREALQDPRFRFSGFDLVDHEGGNSALVNCGGFPLAFRNDELSEYGLLTDYGRARTVQAALRQHYPDERHAQCDLWALWRMVSGDDAGRISMP